MIKLINHTSLNNSLLLVNRSELIFSAWTVQLLFYTLSTLTIMSLFGSPVNLVLVLLFIFVHLFIFIYLQY